MTFLQMNLTCYWVSKSQLCRRIQHSPLSKTQMTEALHHDGGCEACFADRPTRKVKELIFGNRHESIACVSHGNKMLGITGVFLEGFA